VLSEWLAARASAWSGGRLHAAGVMARAAALGMLRSFPVPATSMLLLVVLLPQIVISCEIRRDWRVKAR
jgi:hypothetical protein